MRLSRQEGTDQEEIPTIPATETRREQTQEKKHNIQKRNTLENDIIKNLGKGFEMCNMGTNEATI